MIHAYLTRTVYHHLRFLPILPHRASHADPLTRVPLRHGHEACPHRPPDHRRKRLLRIAPPELQKRWFPSRRPRVSHARHLAADRDPTPDVLSRFLWRYPDLITADVEREDEQCPVHEPDSTPIAAPASGDGPGPPAFGQRPRSCRPPDRPSRPSANSHARPLPPADAACKTRCGRASRFVASKNRWQQPRARPVISWCARDVGGKPRRASRCVCASNRYRVLLAVKGSTLPGARGPAGPVMHCAPLPGAPFGSRQHPSAFELSGHSGRGHSCGFGATSLRPAALCRPACAHAARSGPAKNRLNGPSAGPVRLRAKPARRRKTFRAPPPACCIKQETTNPASGKLSLTGKFSRPAPGSARRKTGGLTA